MDRIHYRNVTELMERVFDELVAETKGKFSVGDYIKLVDVEQALREQEMQEVRVQWVDPFEMEPAPSA